MHGRLGDRFYNYYHHAYACIRLHAPASERRGSTKSIFNGISDLIVHILGYPWIPMDINQWPLINSWMRKLCLYHETLLVSHVVRPHVEKESDNRSALSYL
jgi:hypothetical protein